MAAPTAEEKQILPKFREAVSDLKLEGFVNTDLGLLQWLRARDLNIPKAEEMLRKSHKWRSENEIDSILSWEPPSDFSAMCPIEFAGYDKDNCPVCVIPFGRWDLRQVYNSGHRENYMKNMCHLFEKLLDKMKGRVMPSGEPVTQYVIISDMQGLSMRTLACLGAINMQLEGLQVFEANYPETMKISIVINASRVFATFFNLIKPMLSQRTFGKIRVHDTNVEAWRAVVLDTIDEDQLPKELIESWKNAKIEEDDDGTIKYVTTTLAAGQKISVDIEVKVAESVLSWTYMTTNYDIGFSLVQGSNELVPPRKVNSHTEEQEGSLTCDTVGIYSFVFDNSYSRVREKILTYRISVTEPEGA